MFYEWQKEPNYDFMKQATLDLELDGAYICSAVAVEKDVAVTAGHCVQQDGNISRLGIPGHNFAVSGSVICQALEGDEFGTISLKS